MSFPSVDCFDQAFENDGTVGFVRMVSWQYKEIPLRCSFLTGWRTCCLTTHMFQQKQFRMYYSLTCLAQVLHFSCLARQAKLFAMPMMCCLVKPSFRHSFFLYTWPVRHMYAWSVYRPSYFNMTLLLLTVHFFLSKNFYIIPFRSVLCFQFKLYSPIGDQKFGYSFVYL